MKKWLPSPGTLALAFALGAVFGIIETIIKGKGRPRVWDEATTQTTDAADKV